MAKPCSQRTQPPLPSGDSRVWTLECCTSLAADSGHEYAGGLVNDVRRTRVLECAFARAGLVYETGSIPGGILVFFIAACLHEDVDPNFRPSQQQASDLGTLSHAWLVEI